MPFDDILKRSLDALARDLNSAVQAEREDASRRAKDVAEESVASAIADAQAVGEQRGMTAGREEGLAEGRRQGFHQGRQEGYEAGKSDGYLLGKEEGFLAGKDEGFLAGKDEGFLAGKGAGTNADAADQATAERLADAIRAIDRSRSLSEVLDTLAGCAGRETTRTAVFLVRDGQLRGWRFIGFGPDFDRAATFEAPLKDGGILEEAIRTEAAISTDSSAPGTAPRFAEMGQGCEMFAAPLLVGGRAVAALYADQHVTGKEGRALRFAWRHALEMMARHAGRCLEAITAIRSARLLTDTHPRPGERAEPGGSPASDEDSAARRYAKLLVSEIKLYHEADVLAGRRERDLGTRLGGEIARSRRLYEQRVPAPARAGVDYFQQELVQTLAEGDESLLKSEV